MSILRTVVTLSATHIIERMLTVTQSFPSCYTPYARVFRVLPKLQTHESRIFYSVLSMRFPAAMQQLSASTGVGAQAADPRGGQGGQGGQAELLPPPDSATGMDLLLLLLRICSTVSGRTRVHKQLSAHLTASSLPPSAFFGAVESIG